MKRIDSSNALLVVCLGFLLVVMLGLILQSCRTARLDNSIQNLSENRTENKTFAVDDRVSLFGMSQQWVDNTRIVIRDYVLANDSSGQPIPVLNRETEFRHDMSYQRDSISQLTDKSLSVDSTSSESVSQSEVSESVDKQPYFNTRLYWLLIPLVLFVVFKIKSFNR